MKTRIVIVGGGITGLTTALVLAQQGRETFDIEIWQSARGLAPKHALWEIPPFLIEPQSLATKWALETLVELRRLASTTKDAGVTLIKLAMVSRHADALTKLGVDDASNSAAFDSVHSSALLRQAPLSTKIPFGVYKDACLMTAPVIDTAVYMRYLDRELRKLGVRFNRRSIESFEDVTNEHKDVSIIVNCTGVEAKRLADDENVYAVRGQICSVRAPWIDFALNDVDTCAYVIPFPGKDLECGGTTDENDYNRLVRQSDTAAIMRKCVDMIPSLSNCTPIDSWVGLRPARKGGVRIEIERLPKSNVAVIHCYGHGGSGFTCSYGSANAVLQHVNGVLRGPTQPRAKL